MADIKYYRTPSGGIFSVEGADAPDEYERVTAREAQRELNAIERENVKIETAFLKAQAAERAEKLEVLSTKLKPLGLSLEDVELLINA